RREGGSHLASDLIRAAVAHTRAEWPDVPDLGMVTFVDPAEIASTNPGFCYLRAGFERDGHTEGGLPALRLRPERMPEATPTPSDQLALWVEERKNRSPQRMSGPPSERTDLDAHDPAA